MRWARASYGAVHELLTNPVYAGAFVFGRTRQREARRRQRAAARRTVEVPLEEWSVCLPEHHPGYVSWEEYLATRERLRANVRPRGEGGGAAREGGALLQGLVRCGRCGRRMQVAYSGNDGRCVRYACVRGFSPCTAPTAPASRSAARGWIKAVAAAFLDAVTPAGVAASTGAIARARAARRAPRRSAARGRARPVRSRARATPVRRVRARAPARRAHARARLEEALADRRARTAHARRARARPARAAHRRRAPTRSTRLARDLPRLWAANTTTRPRPQGAAAHADQRDRRDRQPAREHRPRSRSSGKAARAPS